MFGIDPNKYAPQAGYDYETFKQQTALTQRQGGGGGRPLFAVQMHLVDNEPNYIRLIPGQYANQVYDRAAKQIREVQLPWLERVIHRKQLGNRRSMEFVCSGGPVGVTRELRSPCHGCDTHYQEKEAADAAKNAGRQQPPQTMSRTPVKILSALDRGLYVKAPVIDWKTYQPRVNKDGKSFEDVYRVSLQRTQWLRTSGFVKEEIVGHAAPLVLMYELWKTLSGYAEKSIAASCRSCGGHATVVTRGYQCPSCGQPHIDIAQLGRHLIEPEIVRFTSGHIPCRHCGTVAPPKAFYYCNQCPNPSPATIFDVWLVITPLKGDGEKDKRSYQLQHHLAPVDQELAHKAVALDLLKDFKPTPLDQQVSA